LLDGFLRTKEWMMKGIHDSRLKDYTSPFRKMTYENEQEMEIVTGKFSDNTFILQQQQELEALKKTVQKIKLQFKRNQKG
jgi:hypothetical protein